ncbi:MAG: PEGA domain-containing protein [Polyangiales bacterium]
MLRPTRARRGLAVLIFAFAAGVCHPVSAGAQPRVDAGVTGETAAAAAAFREGAERYQRGEYSLAAQSFRRAQGLAPHPNTRFNLARSLEAAGELTEALAAWEAYRAEVRAPDDVRDADARIEALRSRPVEVFVATEPLGASLTVDADPAPSGVTPLRVRLRPGAHVLVLRREGHRERVQRVEVAPATPQDVTVRLEPEASPAPAVTPAPPTPRAPTQDERILARRRGGFLGWFSGRAAATFGLAWPRQSLRFANGVDLTLFVRRIVAVQMHVLRIEDAGSPLMVLGELGWVYAADDIDIGLFLHAGALLDCDQICPEGTSASELIAGGTVRADVVLHPHIGVGLFARFSWLNLEFTRSESLLSTLGFSVSLYL